MNQCNVTPISRRMSFEEGLRQAAVDYEVYAKACDNIDPHSEDGEYNRVQPKDIVEDYVRGHIKQSVFHANQIAPNNSNTKIKVADLPTPFNDYKLFRTHVVREAVTVISQMTVSEIVEIVVSEWSESRLVHSLRKLEGSIQDRGYTNASESIGYGMFRLLSSKHADRQGPIELRQVKGKIVLRVGLECLDRVDIQISLREWMPNLRTIENETGVEGMYAAFEALNTALEPLAIFEKLKSRTRIANNSVEIVSFKSHLNIHVDPSVFESLYGFLQAYCPSDRVVPEVCLPQRK